MGFFGLWLLIQHNSSIRCNKMGEHSGSERAGSSDVRRLEKMTLCVTHSTNRSLRGRTQLFLVTLTRDGSSHESEIGK